MSRADYEHWNEERDIVWWQEEGQHYGHEDPPDPDEEQYEIRTRYPDDPPDSCYVCGGFKASAKAKREGIVCWRCKGTGTLSEREWDDPE